MRLLRLLAILRLLLVSRLLLLVLLGLAVSAAASHAARDGAANHVTHGTAHSHASCNTGTMVTCCSFSYVEVVSPPAVAAICLNMLGCCGCAIMGAGAAGGAAIGVWRDGAGGGGEAARGAARGGGAARPRLGMISWSENEKCCTLSDKCELIALKR